METNLTDDGQLQPGIVPETLCSDIADSIPVPTWGNPDATLLVHRQAIGEGVKIPVTNVTMTYTTPSGEHTDVKYPDGDVLFTNHHPIMGITEIALGKDVPQTYADYVATCGKTQEAKFACRGCGWVQECK